MKSVLTIAGSDCSGGAGIQADIKTITMHKVYASSVITAITAQNTMGISKVESLSEEILEQQLKSVFEDIFPDAVKIGMVDKPETIQVIVEALEKYHPKNVVIDTVMISTSGRKLLEEEAFDIYTKKLLPLADIITPNIPEAQVLSGIKITDSKSRKQAADSIGEKYSGAILIKGGHEETNADDLLYLNGKFIWYQGERIKNSNTHGTGCTLSSAIASYLALGFSMEKSVEIAKKNITGAIEAKLVLGHGNGPLNHMWYG